MALFKLFFLFSLILFFFLRPSRSHGRCPTGCGPVPIRFPFQMNTSLPENRCGYPGFAVICKNEAQNILTFPSSGEFRIENINYLSQVVWINDPNDCTARRLLQGFDYSDTPFQPLYTRNYTFFNCTADSPILVRGATPISCLSTGNYYVIALPTNISDVSNTSGCLEIATNLYPTSGDAWGDSFGDFIKLTWKKPYCKSCESLREVCWFENDTGLDVECFKPWTSDPGFLRHFIHASVYVVGSAVLIIGLIIWVHFMIQQHGHGPPGTQTSDSTIPQGNGAAKGLDTPAIEMYPTTLLGESLQLPNSTDNICPICLLEYQAKEVLRTIPSCLHYFHTDCIDEWLKRNATCPVCRS